MEANPKVTGMIIGVLIGFVAGTPFGVAALLTVQELHRRMENVDVL